MTRLGPFFLEWWLIETLGNLRMRKIYRIIIIMINQHAPIIIIIIIIIIVEWSWWWWWWWFKSLFAHHFMSNIAHPFIYVFVCVCVCPFIRKQLVRNWTKSEWVNESKTFCIFNYRNSGSRLDYYFVSFHFFFFLVIIFIAINFCLFVSF